MTEPLRIFGLPISSAMYGVNWIMTNAQMELIMCDVAVTVYPKTKKGKTNRGGNSRGKEHEFNIPTAESLNAAAERWKTKYSKRDVKININEFI